MAILSKELAEDIVERTMQAVNYNINIMNEHGVIIASGDKSRIGTIHEGAILAINRKTEFKIDEKQSKQLSGVHNGINLVIEFQNKVVGVIGITGQPEDVLGYGKLVKMTAEMMIEQAYVMREIEWNNRIKEEMMLSIINNKYESSRLFQEYMKKFNIPANHPMAIFIIELSLRESINNETSDINRIINILEGSLKESLAAMIDSETIVLLYKCPGSIKSFSEYTENIRKICDNIYSRMKISIKFSLGKIYTRLSDLHKSFDIANETLIFGKKVHPQSNIYIFDLLKNEMIFIQNNSDWKINELRETYKLIIENDKNGELRDTLKILIEENGELNNVASRMFIHRNTLNYRLNKICKITNKNPKNYIDLFWLYSAMINFQTHHNNI